MKLTVIGAGSSYTPELLEYLGREPKLGLRELCLYDIDTGRLDAVAGFCLRYAGHLGLPFAITATGNQGQALRGADFVITQIRVGGNAARALDEDIPLSMGLIGQETTGAGGFAKALRTIPQMLDLAEAMREFCPEAWMINYTNPTGILAEAVHRHADIKMAGLCSGGMIAPGIVAEAAGCPREAVTFDLVGLNHLSFSYNLHIDGQPISPEVWEAICAAREPEDSAIMRHIAAIPSGYLQYYYHASRRVRELREAPVTRARQVMALEKDIFADFADPDCHAKPASLEKRGGGGYAEVAIGAIKAISRNCPIHLSANLPNRGTVDFLPDDASVETLCRVDAKGFHPLPITPPPRAVTGLIAAVKAYETMTVQAAVTGDRTAARMALTAHPLCGDWDVAGELLDKLLDAHRAYLPRFFA